MSEHIDTREGWREINVTSEEAHLHAIYQLAEYDRNSGELVRAWVRQDPIPPLPTEPYTVIRVHWKDGCSPAEILTLVGDMWGDYTAGNLNRNISGWEPLAEPPIYTGNQYAEIQKARIITAKAVLDRVREELLRDSVVRHIPPVLDDIEKEFGVSNA